jgi:hypothetical protein
MIVDVAALQQVNAIMQRALINRRVTFKTIGSIIKYEHFLNARKDPGNGAASSN